MTDLADYRTSAIIGEGITICGITPKTPLITRCYEECFNCNRIRLHVRRFSGSGWYEDTWLCLTCGENMDGYHPFKPGWREANIKTAREWLAIAVPAKEFRRLTRAAIKEEMGWDDDE